MSHAIHRRGLLLMATSLPLGACAQKASAPPPGPGMAASVTYLNLLAKVPFFKALTREQLQWVIDHSREWATEPGAVIASSSRGANSFWVLLDGGWQIEHAGKTFKAGHADPAKWYGGRDMQALGVGDTRVVGTAKSYVIEIQQPELDQMIQRGFAFGPHLESGLAFYRSLRKT
ncbi:hypothetical protein [Ottowia thiooxydans]|uniref:Cyclic nucleotide-binding domain-containing protein n=1 Tax=Ottowia thiooxydans TaxID=219182 RepID=A0ABV2QDP7_9BURK